MAGQKKINVMVVNDSKFITEFISDIVNSNKEFEVLDKAKDGLDALRKLSKTKPDVLIVDLEMPNMDGLSLIKKAVTDFQIPIIVVSAYSQEGSQLVFDCLEAGAVDFIPLPHEKSMHDEDFKSNLLSKIEIASHVIPNHLKNKIERNRPPINKIKNKTEKVSNVLIIIGASTGGPKVISNILSMLPSNIQAGIIIVQHMPTGFTASYAKRLNAYSKLTVREARDGDVIKDGEALIAPADFHLMVIPPNHVYLNHGAKRFGVRPSINVTMITASEVFSSKTLGVLLTGMGHDGAFGMKMIKQRGGTTLAQDESSCTVYGMPKSAYEIGAVDEFISDQNIAEKIEEKVAILV